MLCRLAHPIERLRNKHQEFQQRMVSPLPLSLHSLSASHLSRLPLGASV